MQTSVATAGTRRRGRVERFAGDRYLAAMASPLFALRKRPWFQRLTAALDRPVSTKALGLPFPVAMRLGPNLSLIVRGKRAEPRERAAFVRLLDELQPRSFWDVGANVGLYGFTFAARFPDRPCIMVEPDPKNAACLRRTIERAKLPAAQVLEAAVSDRAGEARFAVDPLTGATGQLVDGQMTFVERHHKLVPPATTVRTVTLDDMRDRYGPPDLVKIDVEQGELAVLQGATALLRDTRPVILIELSGERAAAQSLTAAGYLLSDWRSGEPAPLGAWATLARPAHRAQTPTAD